MSIETSTIPTLLEPLQLDCRVKALGEALTPAELYLVGGCVRDALLCRPIHDIDLATNLTPEQLRSTLETKGFRVIPTGLKHQTVTVLLESHPHPVEITTFRSKGISNASPQSIGASIEEDLQYRDFTINALAVRVGDPQKVLSVQGAVQDISSRTIRAVGDARERFEEDPLRLLRMVRLAVELGCSIEEKTLTEATASASSIQSVAVERIRDEFSRIVCSPHPSRGVQLLHTSNLLQQFLPELSKCAGFAQNRFHHLDVFDHSLLVVDNTLALLENDASASSNGENHLESELTISEEQRLILGLAALLHDIGKVETLSTDDQGERHFYRHESIGADMAREILSRLYYPNRVVEQVYRLISTHMRPLGAGPAGLRRLLRDTGEVFSMWRLLKEGDASACLMDPLQLAKELAEFDREIAHIRSQPDVSPLKNLAINGSDILALGLAEGPQVGVILRALHEMVLDDPELNQRETLLQRAKHLLSVEN